MLLRLKVQSYLYPLFRINRVKLLTPLQIHLSTIHLKLLRKCHG